MDTTGIKMNLVACCLGRTARRLRPSFSNSMRFAVSMIVVVWLGFALAARAEHRVGFQIVDFQLGEQTLTVAVWFPTETVSKPYRYGGVLRTDRVAFDAPVKPTAEGWPLLAWSHGYGGSGIGSVFLAEALAAEGWIVVAPDHSDRDQTVRIRTGPQGIDGRAYLQRARELASTGRDFDRQAHAYRVKELQGAIDGVLDLPGFGSQIQQDHIAVGGHSLGGYTSLALHLDVGQLGEDRIKAILLYSPGVFMFGDEEFAAVTVPTMYWLGEKERTQMRAHGAGGTLADQAFDNLPAPKYFLELKDAGHFAFNNGFSEGTLAEYFQGTPVQFEILTQYSIPFLRKFVQKIDIDVPPFDAEVVKGEAEPDATPAR